MRPKRRQNNVNNPTYYGLHYVSTSEDQVSVHKSNDRKSFFDIKKSIYLLIKANLIYTLDRTLKCMMPVQSVEVGWLRASSNPTSLIKAYFTMKQSHGT